MFETTEAVLTALTLYFFPVACVLVTALLLGLALRKDVREALPVNWFLMMLLAIPLIGVVAIAQLAPLVWTLSPEDRDLSLFSQFAAGGGVFCLYLIGQLIDLLRR